MKAIITSRPIRSGKNIFNPATSTQFVAGKAEASYYDIVVNGDVNKDAAWYYPNPKAAAAEIKDYVAFWRGVNVE